MDVIVHENYIQRERDTIIILINIPCGRNSCQSGEIDWPIQSERHNQKF